MRRCSLENDKAILGDELVWTLPIHPQFATCKRTYSKEHLSSNVVFVAMQWGFDIAVELYVREVELGKAGLQDIAYELHQVGSTLRVAGYSNLPCSHVPHKTTTKSSVRADVGPVVGVPHDVFQLGVHLVKHRVRGILFA